MADLTIENFYKYGYGLLGLRPEELYSLDSFDFLEMVEGSLAWNEHKTDDMLDWFSWFTANQMVATGNFKKGTEPEKVKESLFVNSETARKTMLITKEDRLQDAQTEKDKLIKRFNLPDNKT